MKTIIAAAGLVLVCITTYAYGCEEWDVSHLEFIQGNSVLVDMRLTQNGTEIGGTGAQFYTTTERPFGAYEAVDKRFNGRVLNGVLTGDRLEFDVEWDRSGDDVAVSRGVYKLHIDQFGRLTGTTYDYYKPSSRADIRLDERLRCKPQQQQPETKPVHRLGKLSPSSNSASQPSPQQAEQMTVHSLVRRNHSSDSAPRGQTRQVPIETTSRCRTGLVWREAFDGDDICVTPERRAMVREENRQAALRRDLHGSYGPNTCISGFVWREANPQDTVCVVPEERSRIQEENRTMH